jgi:hypothetical protein
VATDVAVLAATVAVGQIQGLDVQELKPGVDCMITGKNGAIIEKGLFLCKTAVKIAKIFAITF